MIAALLTVTGCSLPPTEGERYSEACRARGGYVGLVKGWDFVEYSCVGEHDPQLPKLRR